MKYAHSFDFIHRILKLSNILISKNGDVKISKFGIPILMTSEKQSSVFSELFNEED